VCLLGLYHVSAYLGQSNGSKRLYLPSGSFDEGLDEAQSEVYSCGRAGAACVCVVLTFSSSVRCAGCSAYATGDVTGVFYGYKACRLWEQKREYWALRLLGVL
jgi:hypothetical protein